MSRRWLHTSYKKNLFTRRQESRDYLSGLTKERQAAQYGRRRDIRWCRSRYIGRVARAIDKGAVARCSIRAATRSMPSVASRLGFSARVQQAGHRLATADELAWSAGCDRSPPHICVWRKTISYRFARRSERGTRSFKSLGLFSIRNLSGMRDALEFVLQRFLHAADSSFLFPYNRHLRERRIALPPK